MPPLPPTSPSSRRSWTDLDVGTAPASSAPAGTLVELDQEGFASLSTDQLRRYLALTDERVIERLYEESLEEKVERVVDVADRFLADPRGVEPSEVTEAKSLLASMRHYDRVLAPIRNLRVDWTQPLGPESDIPPEPRVPWEG